MADEGLPPPRRPRELKRVATRKKLVETEELMTHIIQRPRWKGVVFIAGIVFISSLGGLQTSFNTLAGHIPYNKWKCNENSSQRCIQLTQDGSHFNKTTLCGQRLKQGLHFGWDFDPRKHYTTEWGLYCENWSLHTMVTNRFLGGSVAGALLSGFLVDVIGRKSTALIGLLITVPSTFISTFSPHAHLLGMFRLLQGFGMMVYYSAVYIYLLEICPPAYRVTISTIYMVNWDVGIIIATTIFHIVETWSGLLSVTGFLLVLGIVPLLLGPDSPRFQLVTLRRAEDAKASLEHLCEISGYRFVFDETNYSLKFREQRLAEITGLNLFRLHPKFVRQTLILFAIWFVGGFSYYGFTASFSSLSSDITLSSLCTGVGGILASLISVPPLLFLGRRPTLLIFSVIGSATFVLMVFSWPHIASLSAEEMIGMCGYTSVSAIYCCMYLFTFEQAPTTHRGRIFSACQFAARIGSVLGTEASLLNETHKYVHLFIFASLLLLVGGIAFFTPETRGRPTPDVPIEVEKREEKDEEDEKSGEDKEGKSGEELQTDSI